MKRMIALGAAAATLVLALSGCGARAAREHDTGTARDRQTTPAGTAASTKSPAPATTPPAAATDLTADLNAIDRALDGIDTSLGGIDQNITDADRVGDDDN